MDSFCIIRFVRSNISSLAGLLVSVLALLQVGAPLPEGGRRAAEGGLAATEGGLAATYGSPRMPLFPPLLLSPCHPESLAEEVLCGVHEVHENREAASGPQRRESDESLLERCAADSVCASTFFDPRRALEALLTRLDRQPITVRMRHPRTAQPVPVTLTREAVAEVVRVALYTPVDAARLLQMAER